MKIVVIGGTGLIGSKTVAILRQGRHEVVAASPQSGINTITGEGLKEAMAGAQVVIDLANSPSFEDRAVLDFFETSVRNLLAAEAAAGVQHHVAPRPDTSGAGSRSTRSCRWARRAAAAWVSTNGSAAHRQQPDPASEACPGNLTGPRRLTKEATMTTKLVAIVLLCLMTGTVMAQQPKVTSLMSKDLADNPAREVLMITVEHAPGGSSAIHRHNAHAFVYVLEGSVVMQLKGGQEVTLTPGQTFYEGPDDVHLVDRNASTTQPAKFLAFLIKNKGAPALVPVM